MQERKELKQEREELKARMETLEARAAKNEILLAAVTKKMGVQFVANPALEKEISRLEDRLRELEERRQKREQERRESKAAIEAERAAATVASSRGTETAAEEEPFVAVAGQASEAGEDSTSAIQKPNLVTEGESETMAEEEDDSEEENKESEVVEQFNSLQLSLNSMAELNSTKSWINERIHGDPVIVLIDWGALSNFISVDVVARLKLQGVGSPTYSVEVGNGAYMLFDEMNVGNNSKMEGHIDAMVGHGKCAYVVFDKMLVRTILRSVWNCAQEVFDKKTVRPASIFFKQWDPGISNLRTSYFF